MIKKSTIIFMLIIVSQLQAGSENPAGVGLFAWMHSKIQNGVQSVAKTMNTYKFLVDLNKQKLSNVLLPAVHAQTEKPSKGETVIEPEKKSINVDYSDLFTVAKEGLAAEVVVRLKELKEAGINPRDIKNEDGDNLLHETIYGAQKDPDSCVIRANRLWLIERLVKDFNISPNSQNNSLQTPAHYCSWLNNKTAINVYLTKLQELGAHFELNAKSGGNVLDYFLNDFSDGKYSENYAAGVSVICKSGFNRTAARRVDKKRNYFYDRDIFGTLEDNFHERAERQLQRNADHNEMLRVLLNDCKCSPSEEVLTQLKKSGWR